MVLGLCCREMQPDSNGYMVKIWRITSGPGISAVRLRHQKHGVKNAPGAGQSRLPGPRSAFL